MISFRLPDADRMARLLEAHSEAPFSYPDVGATQGVIPPRYNVDRSAAVIGKGNAAFESAKQAIRNWAPFRLPWIRVFPQAAPRKGVVAAVVARLFGFWWTNISRVVYTIDEPNAFGFAYGTLQFHAEIGEELFLVERSPESEEVTYRILAFSRPRHPLARIGYPLSRAAQRRFRTDSIETMRNVASRQDV